uniref:WH2 domain-containing protein n=1 Tax=Anisakis simplex TaxID=6269 RepID=A0A0M3JET1_ANISI
LGALENEANTLRLRKSVAARDSSPTIKLKKVNDEITKLLNPQPSNNPPESPSNAALPLNSPSSRVAPKPFPKPIIK